MLILRKLPLKIKLRRKVGGRNLGELISFRFFFFFFINKYCGNDLAIEE